MLVNITLTGHKCITFIDNLILFITIIYSLIALLIIIKYKFQYLCTVFGLPKQKKR